MRLVTDDIVIQHNQMVARLRPSLRAAYILQCRHGLTNLYHGVVGVNLSIIEDIVAETADSMTAKRVLIAQVDEKGARQLRHLVDPLCELLKACFGIVEGEDHDSEKRERRGKRFSIKETLEYYYGMATGLGWSPADALAATPAQIVAAHSERLKSIYGSADEAATEYDPHEADISPEELHANLAKLRDLARHR